MSHDLRDVYRVDGDTRTRVRMSELRKGDVFAFGDGSRIWRAVSDPTQGTDGVWGVQATEDRRES